MATVGRDNTAAIECVLGGTGCGKTSYVMGQLRRKKPRRVLVWDTKGEFAREGYAIAVASMAELARAIHAAGNAGPFRLAYQPRGDVRQMAAQFDRFCCMAYDAKRLTLVAEELADVTQASWAPAGWRQVSSKGRTEGLSVYGLSQRPSSLDKHFFSNATFIRAGRLNFAGDTKVVANVLRVPLREVEAMMRYDWIGRDMLTGAISRGK